MGVGGWRSLKGREEGGRQNPRCPLVCSLFPSPFFSPPHPQPQLFQCPPTSGKAELGFDPQPVVQFRSSCPGLWGEEARNAGAEAWAAPDRAGSEFWECLCSWSPLGEGAGRLLIPALFPGGAKLHRSRGGGGSALGGWPQPSAPSLFVSQAEAWRSGALHLTHNVHTCTGSCVPIFVEK